jgi:ubiquitin C-terminal hydrolase
MNSVMQCIFSIDKLVANLPRAISTDLNKLSPSKGKLTKGMCSSIHPSRILEIISDVSEWRKRPENDRV